MSMVAPHLQRLAGLKTNSLRCQSLARACGKGILHASEYTFATSSGRSSALKSHTLLPVPDRPEPQTRSGVSGANLGGR